MERGSWRREIRLFLQISAKFEVPADQSRHAALIPTVLGPNEARADINPSIRASGTHQAFREQASRV